MDWVKVIVFILFPVLTNADCLPETMEVFSDSCYCVNLKTASCNFEEKECSLEQAVLLKRYPHQLDVLRADGRICHLIQQAINHLQVRHLQLSDELCWHSLPKEIQCR